MIYLINLLTANADVVATSCKLSGSYLHPPEVCRVLFYSAFKFTERGHLNTIHSNLLKCTKDIKVYLLFIENILSAKIIFSRYFREEKKHKNCIQIANCCPGSWHSWHLWRGRVTCHVRRDCRGSCLITDQAIRDAKCTNNGRRRCEWKPNSD